MNAGKNAGMVLRAETGQSYLQETPTWRTKQGRKLGEGQWCWKEIDRREHVVEFFLFCFLFLIGHKKLLKEFNMGTNINNLGCYLKLQLIRSAVERILYPISWAKLS